MAHSPTQPKDFVHDVKNHITVISAYIELLELWKKSPQPSEEQFKKYLNILKERSQQLVKLVEKK